MVACTPLGIHRLDISMTLPIILKKHVSTVQAKVPDNWGLTHRKIFNSLQQFAASELRKKAGNDLQGYCDSLLGKEIDFTIPLRELQQHINYGSENREYIYSVFDEVAGAVLRYDVIGDGNTPPEFLRYSIINKIHVKHGNVIFRFPSEILPHIANPEIYATIDLAIQNKLKSGRGHALYEFIIRYHRIGSTAWVTVNQLREWLGVRADQYSEYKAFKRSLLMKLIKSFTDIDITLEEQKTGRKVTHLRFSFKVNKNAANYTSIINEKESNLERRLLNLKLSKKQIAGLFSNFSEHYLHINLEHLTNEIQGRSDIKNIPAYIYSSLTRMTIPDKGEVPKTPKEWKEADIGIAASSSSGEKLSYEAIKEIASKKFMLMMMERYHDFLVGAVTSSDRKLLNNFITGDTETNEFQLKFGAFVSSEVYIHKKLKEELMNGG